jgi:hypothetical protein
MCKATIPLESFKGARCCLPKHHSGPHASDAFGPRITWPKAPKKVSA